jgi:hypothetical protein
METWKRVFRDGISPQLTAGQLERLRDALANDDVRLVQWAVCSPPAVPSFAGLRVEAACAIGYCGWQGEGLQTVGEVSAFFLRVCDGTDAKLGEPAAVRYFLDWFDDAPREVMRRELLAEVRAELARRAVKAGPVASSEGV